MAELVPAPFSDLVRRVCLELERDDAIFHLPRRKWWRPDPAGPDLSVRFHDQRAGTPVGPAAGPQSQMAQNLVLSWLAGSRIMELKTVQINDRLRIGRPCIDATNVGYNIEWSQELRIAESLREYVAGSMLIHMLSTGGLLGEDAITTRATETIYDMSVGYDLAGIQSAPVRSFIEQMRDATSIVDRLRMEIPDRWRHLRDLDYPTRLSTSITLSTFHGCPADEIERICTFLIGELDCDVIIKMNPPMLSRERLEHLLYEVMGYTELTVPDHAYTNGLQFDESIDICRRLSALASERGRRLGAKFSNTLEVLNHRDFFDSNHEIQYLSGQPLHVLTLTLAEVFRAAVGPDMPVTFSAGVDRQNFANMVACGFRPVTVCTDLLRPGGYGRLPPYLDALAKAMVAAGADSVDAFICAQGDGDSDVAGAIDCTAFAWADAAAPRAAAANLMRIAAETRDEARYHAAENRKVPRRIDSHLETFDCITCDKCIPVCPNAANFTYRTEPERLDFNDWVVSGDALRAGPQRMIEVERADQIANFADFCNDCGNCDTFCPEYDGPFIMKPNFFGSLGAWSAFPQRDGFYIDTCGSAPIMHGRIRGRTFRLDAEPDWGGYRFEDGEVCVFVRAADHAVERWFAFGPHDATGHTIDMHAFHTMRILLTSLLRTDHVHQVNCSLMDAAAGDGGRLRPA